MSIKQVGEIKLFVGSNYSIKLANEDILLRKRAEVIIEKFEKTKTEFLAIDYMIGEEVYNGVAEMDAFGNFVQKRHWICRMSILISPILFSAEICGMIWKIL